MQAGTKSKAGNERRERKYIIFWTGLMPCSASSLRHTGQSWRAWSRLVGSRASAIHDGHPSPLSIISGLFAAQLPLHQAAGIAM